MNGVIADVKYALRLFRKSPGFAAVAIGTLALGISANTVIFSGVEALLLRPVPAPNSVRVALGATRTQVVRLMIRDGMMPVLAGTAAGILGAIVLSDSLEGLLFQTKALDTLAFSAAIAGFLTSALAGSALAARRAAGVDPVRALRIG